MTGGPQSVPGPSVHSDSDLIAARPEGCRGAAEPAQVDEHLSRCPGCDDTVSETARFGLEDGVEGLPRASFAEPPLAQRPAFRIAAVLAVAVGVLLAFQQLGLRRALEDLRQRYLGRDRSALVAELTRAMGATRFIEPRLTGGFQHGQLVILRPGYRPQGLDAFSPDVLAAVARIRERAQGDTSPEALGALAVTHLVSGDVDRAVKALEAATAQAPADPRFQSDLAAAYLVRASRLDEPADFPKALEAAERAIESENAPPEAWFNRALALAQLHLVDSTKKAWEDFLERDSTSAWADEARRHLEDPSPEQQSTIEEDRARARTAVAEGPAAINALADETPAALADYLLAELLPRWADAYLTGHPSAVVLRAQVGRVGEALLRTTGDALARDAALALSSFPSSSSRDPQHSQALGYKTLREAHRVYGLGEISRSCALFRESRRLLHDGASPYWALAQERTLVACPDPAEPQAVLALLDELEGVAARGGYAGLVARVRMLQAEVHWHRGELTTALDRLRLARIALAGLRDSDSEGRALGMLAETFYALGDSRRAWQARHAALALRFRLRNPRVEPYVLAEAASTCEDEHLPRCAGALQSALVVSAKRSSDARAIGWAFLGHARMLRLLGSTSAASEDLATARVWIARIGDSSWRDRLEAEADAVEGELLAEEHPDRAVQPLEQALAYFKVESPVRTPPLNLLLARVHARRGRDDEAEAELAAGIRTLESERLSLRDVALQAGFFDQAAPLFEEMVNLQVDRRDDPERGLAFVERGRARQLAEALARASPDRGDDSSSTSRSPLEPGALQRRLPVGVALVYYATREDRLLAWTLTHEHLEFIEHRVLASELRKLVASYLAAIEGRAALWLVRALSGRVYDELIRPLAPTLDGEQVLIFIPDGDLESIPYASLWDRQKGRYLVEDRLVGLAPSGATFLRASAAATLERAGRAPVTLAVGNPRLEQGEALWPPLPGAEAEAATIAALYPNSELLTGPAATKTAFLKLAKKSQVVHFAGHAVSGEVPGTAHLLLARDPSTADSGVLYLHELLASRLPRTSVVVLAACRTAAGSASRLGGGMSLARPFLAAGVHSVVASLWDIDDQLGRRFFVAFHRTLQARVDPLEALRQTQLSMIRDSDPMLAHPASWAGFVCAGGLDARRLPHGRAGSAGQSR